MSSAAGIAQIEKDNELQVVAAALLFPIYLRILLRVLDLFQGIDPTKCLYINQMLSEEAMDHVKKMCGELASIQRIYLLSIHKLCSGPGYTIDKLGVPQPIEPEFEGSSMAKGPGYFYQPHALVPGTSTDTMLGDEQSKLTEDELAFVCKVSQHVHSMLFAALTENLMCEQAVEDDQAEIKKACFQYFFQYFKAMDEEGKGVLVGDAFKTVIGKLEEDMPMEAKECPWMTPKASKLIEDAGAEGLIDYSKFLMEELESPRDDAL